MSIDETKLIVDKIKSFRPFFQTGLSKSQEIDFVRNWSKVFEPYDYKEVDKKLDQWFSERGHFGKTPEPYELITGLLTIVQKTKLHDKNIIIIFCPICRKKYGLIDFDNHYKKCSSIEFIYLTRKKYFEKHTDKSMLWKIDDKKFEELYIDYCKRLLDKNINGDERKSIIRVLKSREVISVQEENTKRKSDGIS